MPKKPKATKQEKINAKANNEQLGKVVPPTKKLSDNYRKELNKINTGIKHDIDENLLPLIKENASIVYVDNMINVINDRWKNIVDNEAYKFADGFVNEASSYVLQTYYKDSDEIYNIMGNVFTTPEMISTTEANVIKNTALIKSIPNEYIGKVKNAVMNSFGGEYPLLSEIQKIANHQYGVSKSRVKLIARDQTNKVVSQVSRESAKLTGATEYIWRTSGSNNVRETHAKLDGRTFSYDVGAPLSYASAIKTGKGFHPGEDIQCGCVAIPIIPLNQ